MKDVRIKSFPALHAALSKYSTGGWLFRGQGDVAWPLKPSIGRWGTPAHFELGVFQCFKNRAVPYIGHNPSNDWDWLAVAQHYGLQTRLLDWTSTPLVAAFFAVAADGSADAAIYALRTTNVADQTGDPMKFNGVALFEPRDIAARITQQRGMFTIHGSPGVPMQDALHPSDTLVRIIVEGAYRTKLREDLHFYGVNHATLFPDLGGLAKHLNWWNALERAAAQPASAPREYSKPRGGGGGGGGGDGFGGFHLIRHVFPAPVK